MRPDVDRYDRVAIYIEYDSEVPLDFGGVNSPAVTSGELVNLMGTQARIERVLFENSERDARDAVAQGAACRSYAKMRESRGTDISFITGIRLAKRSIQVDKSASFRIGHALLERFRDPGIVIFHDKFRDLRPLARGKGFELLDNFSGAHDD